MTIILTRNIYVRAKGSITDKVLSLGYANESGYTYYANERIAN
jgi:hypothetical protein